MSFGPTPDLSGNVTVGAICVECSSATTRLPAPYQNYGGELTFIGSPSPTCLQLASGYPHPVTLITCTFDGVCSTLIWPVWPIWPGPLPGPNPVPTPPVTPWPLPPVTPSPIPPVTPNPEPTPSGTTTGGPYPIHPWTPVPWPSPPVPHPPGVGPPLPPPGVGCLYGDPCNWPPPPGPPINPAPGPPTSPPGPGPENPPGGDTCNPTGIIT